MLLSPRGQLVTDAQLATSLSSTFFCTNKDLSVPRMREIQRALTRPSHCADHGLREALVLLCPALRPSCSSFFRAPASLPPLSHPLVQTTERLGPGPCGTGCTGRDRPQPGLTLGQRPRSSSDTCHGAVSLNRVTCVVSKYPSVLSKRMEIRSYW